MQAMLQPKEKDRCRAAAPNTGLIVHLPAAGASGTKGLMITRHQRRRNGGGGGGARYDTIRPYLEARTLVLCMWPLKGIKPR